MSIPIIVFDERKAMDAYDAHRAVLMAEQKDPALRQNPFWTMIRQDAFEQFARAFSVIS